jgi:hypothetical protein
LQSTVVRLRIRIKLWPQGDGLKITGIASGTRFLKTVFVPSWFESPSHAASSAGAFKLRATAA